MQQISQGCHFGLCLIFGSDMIQRRLSLLREKRLQAAKKVGTDSQLQDQSSIRSSGDWGTLEKVYSKEATTRLLQQTVSRSFHFLREG